MEGFTKKTLNTSRGLQYTYWVRSSTEKKVALLLQHGFPDDHDLWSNILPYLIPLGHPIIVPDLLGYGETAKPSDAKEYNIKSLSNDLMDILDREGYQHAISIGHDWGAMMAQRLLLFHPERVVGLVLLNVAYRAPTEANAEQANAMLVQYTGLPRLAYQQFFISPQARQLMENNLESTLSALHGSDEGTKNFMEDLLCHHGALEEYLQAGKRQPLKDHAKKPGFSKTFIARMKRDGFEGPLNWYKAVHANHNWHVEREVPEERHRINVPVLFIGCTKDPVCLTQMIFIPQKAGLLPDLTVEEIESGHWQTFEAPHKTGPIIQSWLKNREFDLTARL